MGFKRVLSNGDNEANKKLKQGGKVGAAGKEAKGEMTLVH